MDSLQNQEDTKKDLGEKTQRISVLEEELKRIKQMPRKETKADFLGPGSKDFKIECNETEPHLIFH